MDAQGKTIPGSQGNNKRFDRGAGGGHACKVAAMANAKCPEQETPTCCYSQTALRNLTLILTPVSFLIPPPLTFNFRDPPITVNVRTAHVKTMLFV